MRIELPEKVKKILDTLTEAGYEAYAVGGCVRDSILGRIPNDWDVTTSAKPVEVKALFPRTVDTGIQHGTVTVMLGREGFEVTTYRIDGEYEDSRHPKEVTFTASLAEDLKRRDFTINAMAYNEQSGLVDLFDGIRDIRERRIRCVGNPEERFSEDALRMMRAVRFSAQLGYEIEEETEQAVVKLAPTLSKISAERIQTELLKLVLSDHPDYLHRAYETGLTSVFFPEFDRAMEQDQNHPHHKYSVGEHTLHAMQAVEPERVLRLTMLFHDLGKPDVHTVDEDGIDHFKGHAAVGEEIAHNVLRRLKFDNDTIDQVKRLVFYHDYHVAETQSGVRRAANKIGVELFPALLKVKYADVAAQSDYKRQEKLDTLQHLDAIYREVLEEGQCMTLKDLAVTGKDLIECGMQPGKELGEALSRLLEVVLDHPEYNTKEQLLRICFPESR